MPLSLRTVLFCFAVFAFTALAGCASSVPPASTSPAQEQPSTAQASSPEGPCKVGEYQGQWYGEAGKTLCLSVGSLSKSACGSNAQDCLILRVHLRNVNAPDYSIAEYPMDGDQCGRASELGVVTTDGDRQAWTILKGGKRVLAGFEREAVLALALPQERILRMEWNSKTIALPNLTPETPDLIFSCKGPYGSAIAYDHAALDLRVSTIHVVTNGHALPWCVPPAGSNYLACNDQANASYCFSTVFLECLPANLTSVPATGNLVVFRIPQGDEVQVQLDGVLAPLVTWKPNT